MLELLDQIVARSSRNEPTVLCTVVRTRGSTPQGAGATMLVLADGKTIGTLGGGCVEAEVRRRALELIGQRQCRLLTFRLDHDYGWDDGLVCGGIMDVAVQVIDDSTAAAPLIPLRDGLQANQTVTMGVDAVDEKGQTAHFDLEFARAPSLIIAGGGHVGQALATMARRLNFFVTVIDDRPDMLTVERFPGVKTVAGDIERALSSAPIDDQTYVVIVTRGHRHDASALAAVINSIARYIGLIGSKRKVRTILDDLFRSGVSREKLLAVRSPIGLEIGAITPTEIAVSIAAELISVHRGAGDSAAGPMKIPADELNRWLDRDQLSQKPAK